MTESPRADRRWDEPRGPHLPDAIARIPGLAWIFVAVAVARLSIVVDSARLGPAPDPLAVASVVTTAVGSLAVLLVPAALLARHPDVLRRAPILAFGVVLFAIAEVLEALEPTLWPVAAAYSAGIRLLAFFGLALIGLGLARARRMPSHGRTVWTASILVFAGFLVVSRITEAATFLSTSPSGSGDLLYVGTFSGIAILTILAWTYLTIITVDGVRAREEPSNGWTLGATAGGLALLAYLLFAVLTVFVLPDVDLNGLLFLASGLFAAGPLALVLAFAAGLPSLEPASESPAD